ncbi:MAG: acylphosphatase [Methylovulum sp.]|uniref:acylphosphatase n=1 Tax=Methylovulum sp. TaxID=1916980 RepID=UPI00260DB494|nr:acylphosphatase [Methylovulum sp.]MDD2723738.1 acylphosphatase [Methylovulum sp.]MDD5125355.1 acylphosphatase [Methylovulum sp.]
MRRVKILVSGRVQGVYFRVFTQNKAKHFGIHGSVRNLADGRVEIIAEAEHPVIEQFIKWCHKGPITARVDQVDIIDLEADEALTSFQVK